MKNASRNGGFTPLVAGAASLVFGTGIFFLTQRDVAATDVKIQAAKVMLAQRRTAEAHANEMHAHVAEAAKRILPYCKADALNQNDLVFAALDLSRALKPTIDSGATTSASQTASTDVATPAANPSPGASPQADLMHRVIDQTNDAIQAVNATPTEPPVSSQLATDQLTTTYTGNFSALQAALNNFARRPSTIGITLTSITRAAALAETAPRPAAPTTGAAPLPTPAPENKLTISATFHRTAINPAACQRIQNDAGPLASLAH